MEIFRFESYREYLRRQIEANSGQRGYLTKLAKGANCQKSYLTLVVRGEVHFTPEHAMGLAEFWGLSDLESDYFLDLVSFERASTPSLRAKLKKRLVELQKANSDLGKRYSESGIDSSEAQAIYYSAWHMSAIHVTLSIPGTQSAEEISEKLQLPLEIVRTGLAKLREIGVVKNDGSKWKAAKGNLHVGKDSMFNSLNHQNWRTRAVADSQRKDSAGLHYTAVQSVSRDDFRKIRELLLKSIDQQRKIVAPSKDEILATFCCDWFEV